MVRQTQLPRYANSGGLAVKQTKNIMKNQIAPTWIIVLGLVIIAIIVTYALSNGCVSCLSQSKL